MMPSLTFGKAVGFQNLIMKVIDLVVDLLKDELPFRTV